MTRKEIADYEVGSKAWYKQRVFEVHGVLITVVKFSNYSSPVTYSCSKCSHTWTTKTGCNVVSRKSGCPKCAVQIRKTSNLRYTASEYANLVLEKSNGTMSYVGSTDIFVLRDKVLHKCSCCCKTFLMSPTAIKSGRLCPTKSCRYTRSAEKRTRTTEEFELQLREVHDAKLKLVGQYRTGRKLRFKCYTCLRTWKAHPSNVLAGSGCPVCVMSVRRANLAKGAKVKNVKADGISLRLQGYEPQALDWILNRFSKLSAADFVFDSSGEVPTISYRVGRRNRRYYPDMYLPKQNRLIEVKSTYTLGLNTGRGWRRNQEKARACLDQGFKFTLLVMDAKGNRLWLPTDWYKKSRKDVLIEMAFHNGKNKSNTKPEAVFL